MYKIVKKGKLKYDRLKSMQIINKNYSYYYAPRETKELLDYLLSDDFTEFEENSLYIIMCEIFDNVKIEIMDEDVDYPYERNFPDEFISPYA